jgi:glyoxylase-like metal-dependent hydrolase (beta-lactamase superfamily II)
MQPIVKAFYDPVTGTVSYVVHAAAASDCAIIDSVLDYDASAGRTSTRQADRVIAYVREQQLRVAWILETHAHADHVSASAYLKRILGGQVAIGEQICTVQRAFQTVFNLEPEFRADGSQFDQLFADGDQFSIGQLSATVFHVPGHTPADVAYQIGDVLFVGDTLFMPDVGTARCDFPGGDAARLYQSIQKILTIRGVTRLFMCHDYPPAGRAPNWETTAAAQRDGNIHVHDGVSEAAFTALRTARDATLSMPNLILPAIQINIRAGALPPAESDGQHYLKIPLNRF